MEKRAAKAEQVYTLTGVEMNLTDSGSRRNLFWYDADRNLVYYVESSLGADDLAAAFADMQLRLPVYEPTWLPEGFEVAERRDYYPYYDIDYYDSNSDMYSYFGYFDMSEDSSMSVDRLGDDLSFEKIELPSVECYYYPPTEESQADYYIIVDETDRIIFTFVTELEKDTAIKIIESIKCTESDW